ncbi:Protein of unknown function [Lactobacillus acidophilus DSM 9126]|nr:Protein of unknown function [Lactobacillus acidophilus DSM 9126]
MAYALV